MASGSTGSLHGDGKSRPPEPADDHSGQAQADPPVPAAGDTHTDLALEAARTKFTDAAVALVHAVAQPAAAGGGTGKERIGPAGFVTLLIVAVDLALVYRFVISFFPADFLEILNKLAPVVFGTFLAAYVASVGEKLRALANSRSVRARRFRVVAAGALVVCVLLSVVTFRLPVTVSAAASVEMNRRSYPLPPNGSLFVETRRLTPQELKIVEWYPGDEGPMAATGVYPVGTWDLISGTVSYWASRLKLRPRMQLVTATYPLLAYNRGGAHGELLVSGEFAPLYLRKMLRESPRSRRTRGNFATLSYPLAGVYLETVELPPGTFDLVLYDQQASCGRQLPRVEVKRMENTVNFAGLPCDSALSLP